MKRSSLQGGLPAGNPIANVFVVIVGALAIAAFLVIGFFALAIVSALVLILASVVGVRVWWLKRKMQGGAPKDGPSSQSGGGGVIEGEYQVVAEEREGE